ncbi:MAG TPA: efflux RND transporter permease subunit [Thermoleophilaceae bacterium]
MLAWLADLASRRARAVLAGAVVLALAAAALGGDVANRLAPHESDDPDTESVRTKERLAEATGLETVRSIVVLVRSDAGVASPAGRGRVEQVRAKLAAVDGLGGVTARAPVSRDGRATFVAARVRTSAKEKDVVEEVEDELRDEPGVTVGGTATANVAVGRVVEEDLRTSEALAFPILFLLSLWFFRGLVAAALPLLVGGLSIALTFLGMRIASELTTLSVFSLNLVTGLGLGLAIDYSLIVVSRYREEIAREGGAGPEALRRTVTSAGRTVLFSSLTVAAALATLLLFPQRGLYSMAVGGVMVTMLAAAVALLALPAVLALLGERVNSVAPGRLRRAAESEARGEHGRWYRLSQFVMRRPAPIAAGSAALLIALGIPFLGAQFTSIDIGVLPDDEPAKQVNTALEREFPPLPTTPIVVATEGTRADAEALAGRLRALEGAKAVTPPERTARNPRAETGDLWRIDVASRAAVFDDASEDLVRRARSLEAPGGVSVGGETAGFVDYKASLEDHLPAAVIVLVVTTLLLLFAMTGSLILPLKALVMNLLTVSAAFGILVLIFQEGRLEGLLAYTGRDALESSQPVILFAAAFGLSTDYGVFLLSRIKEARDAGASETESVALGLQRTGRVVTAAALLFAVAIGALATSRIGYIKELALGTAFAVLIDATVVRALLVPALMAMLGRWNWWAPGPLRRLHDRFARQVREPGGRVPQGT